MEAVLPAAGLGFALGWPIEWTVQRFPLRVGTPASSRRRLVVAALTAALFAALAVRIGLVRELVPALVLTAVAVAAAVVDLEHRIIPNRLNLAGAALVLPAAVLAQPDRAPELVLGGAGATLLLGAAWFVYPRGMGLGDVKMAPMLGFALGKLVVVGLFAAFALSSVLSLAIIAAHGRGARGIGFPFGPFLAAGTLVALLFGDGIWAWYWG